jgi:hypothetical protein
MHRYASCALALSFCVSVIAAEPSAKTPAPPSNPKYTHGDRLRPRPTVVTPPTASTQKEPGKPPSDAIVLFDGTDLSAWQPWHPDRDRSQEPIKWVIQDGYCTAAGSALETKQTFGDCHVHLEWRTSPEEAAQGEARIDQHRGNSGIEFGDHPEIQVLDSFENDTYPDGQAASIYGSWPPLANATRKPGEWQSYDMIYVAPRFEGKKKVANAVYTVLHNGLPVHHHVEVSGNDVETHIRLRPHGGEIRYRNIWVRPLHQYDENEGKPLPKGARTENPFKK